MSRRLRLALAVLVLAAGALGVVLWRRPPPPTDDERIRTLFAEAARAAEEKQPRDAVRGVSERFRGGGLDRDGVRRMIAFEALRGAWTSATVAGTSVRVEGDRADAVVDLVAARGGTGGAARGGTGRALADLLPGQASAWRIEAALEREPDGWRITAATWREIPLVEALAGPPPPAAR